MFFFELAVIVCYKLGQALKEVKKEVQLMY